MTLAAADIVSLIIQVGLPLAIKLIDKVFSGKDFTQADWEALKADAAQTAKDRMIAQLTAAGIALDSPTAVALIAAAS
jgi:hypothetical protein